MYDTSTWKFWYFFCLNNESFGSLAHTFRIANSRLISFPLQVNISILIPFPRFILWVQKNYNFESDINIIPYLILYMSLKVWNPFTCLDIFWSIYIFMYIFWPIPLYIMFNPGQISFPLYVYAGPINRRSTLSLSLS